MEQQESKSQLNELNEQINTSIKNAGPRIKDIYVNNRVEEEIKKRAEQLGKLVLALTTIKREINKYKPDVITYNEKGEKTSESWSKKMVDDRKKCLDKFLKGEKVLEKALTENDYSTVDSVLNELKVEQKQEQKPIENAG